MSAAQGMKRPPGLTDSEWAHIVRRRRRRTHANRRRVYRGRRAVS